MTIYGWIIIGFLVLLVYITLGTHIAGQAAEHITPYPKLNQALYWLFLAVWPITFIMYVVYALYWVVRMPIDEAVRLGKKIGKP